MPPRSSSSHPNSPSPLRVIRFRSPLVFALCASACFLTFYNLRYWREIVDAFWRGHVMDGLFVLTLSVCLLLLHASVLLALPGRKAAGIAIALACPLGAMAAYCADSFGLPVDTEMLRNVGRTDYREVQGLFGPGIILYALVLGVLPILLVARSRVAPVGWKAHLRQLAMTIAALAAAVALLVQGFPSQAAALAGRHKPLHALLVPGAALSGMLQLVQPAPSEPSNARLARADGTLVLKRPAGTKPLLLFLVIGETARHMNFQLGGYARPTNPELSRLGNVFYFSQVDACATSTALSVPCMLSPLDRTAFRRTALDADRLVLHELAEAGMHVEWRSNNSGSKDLRAGLRALDATRRGAFDCSPWSCLDEVLLQGLPESISHTSGDQLIVFHQMGSHGPDYYRRYPAAFEVFKPACRANALSGCSKEEIRNAYDNTIVYTDHLLKAKIDLLEHWSDRFDTALIYVSDHGESLGENGVYLHGIPYEMAPLEQKRVPLLLWFSPSYIERLGMDAACLGRKTSMPFSHANLYHTLLGAVQAQNAAYSAALDILASCRSGSGSRKQHASLPQGTASAPLPRQR